MQDDDRPTKSDEPAVHLCDQCHEPLFPRAPGNRSTLVRCPNGHWVNLSEPEPEPDAEPPPGPPPFRGEF